MARNGQFKPLVALVPFLWLAGLRTCAFGQQGAGDSKIITIDFKGGSVAEYVKAVADSANKLGQGDFNVVIDEELLSLLAQAHRPSGLIRVGGRVMLTDNRKSGIGQ